MKPSKNALIVKSNHVIEASYNLPLNGHRLLATAISCLNKNATAFNVIKLKAREIAEIFGLSKSKGIYGNFEDIVDELMNSHITIRDGTNWIKYQWVSMSTYKDGFVSLKLNDDLLPYLTSLISFYTSYQLVNVINFTTTYQYRIYDLCKQYEAIGERIIAIPDIKLYLCLPSNTYNMVGHLKSRIIEPSLQAISEHSDLNVELGDDVKSGRKIIAFRFLIEKSHTDGLLVESVAEANPASTLIDELVVLGVSEKIAKVLTRDYSVERIRLAMSYTKAQQKFGKIKNLGGFIVDAIKNEYQDNQAPDRTDKSSNNKLTRNYNHPDGELKSNKTTSRRNDVEDFLGSLTEEQVIELKKNFVEDNKNNPMLLKKYNEDGMKSAMVKGCFYDFVLSRLLKKANI
jgi:plasmid replication initiation protein